MTATASIAKDDWQSTRVLLIKQYTSWLSANPPQLLTMDGLPPSVEAEVHDDRPIALRRKRRSSSVTANPPTPARLARSRLQSSPVTSSAEDTVGLVTGPTTPSKPTRKKVRFSDPGPDAASSTLGDASTGLTPVVRRTTLAATPYAVSSTPRRRQSAGSTPYPIQPITGEVQFPSLYVEMLTPHDRRRIRRNGLSEEMNKIEQEKALERKSQKEIEKLKKEIDTLKSKGLQNIGEHSSVVELQEELDHVQDARRTMNPAADMEVDWTLRYRSSNDFGSEGGDTIPLPDDDQDMVLHSESNPPDSPSRSQNLTPKMTDATAQADMPDLEQEAQLLGFALDLEAAKQEKRQLFSECRSHLPSSDFASGLGFRSAQGAPKSSSLDGEAPSPPANFMKQISQALKTSQARADDAELALCALDAELKTLGFPGNDADDILADIRGQFRAARLELERMVPGETVAAFDNSKLLSALIAHIKALVNQSRERL